MTQRQTNQNKKFLQKGNIVFIFIVALSIALLSYPPLRGVVATPVFAFATGAWGIKESVSSYISTLSVNFRTKDILYAENILLHEEVARMQTEVLDRNLLKERNDGLLEALGRSQSDNRIVANVLVGPKSSPYDTLVVDAGLDIGVSVGNLVFYAGSGIIGEVIEVAKSSSKIMLYSSPGKEHPVIIGPNFIPSTATGRGMGNFDTTVPIGSQVSVGDSVTSVDGKLFFGKISLIQEIQTEPIERLFFRLPFNSASIRTVEIIR